MEDHSLINREAVPLPIARHLFDSALRFSAEDINAACEWAEKKTLKLSIEDCTESFSAFLIETRVEVPNARELLESLFSLEGLRSAVNHNAARFVAFLADDAKKDNRPSAEKADSVRSALIRFFSNPKLQHTLKAQRVYDGFLPNFNGCSSIVDFRPVFDDSRKQIVTGIVTASFSVEVRVEDDGPSMKRFEFQLDMSDISTLLTELNRLQLKVEALKVFADQREVELLNPSKSLKAAE